MCMKKCSKLEELKYKGLCITTFTFGVLQVVTATSAVCTFSSVWWFSIIVGISGIFTSILAILPHQRYISYAVFILSIVSLLTSVFFLIYIEKFVKGAAYTVLVLIGVLQCSFSISCLVLFGHLRYCLCFTKVHPKLSEESELLMPSAPSESTNSFNEEIRLNIRPYVPIQPINIPCPRTPEEDFINHYDAFPQFASHSR